MTEVGDEVLFKVDKGKSNALPSVGEKVLINGDTCYSTSLPSTDDKVLLCDTYNHKNVGVPAISEKTVGCPVWAGWTMDYSSTWCNPGFVNCSTGKGFEYTVLDCLTANPPNYHYSNYGRFGLEKYVFGGWCWWTWRTVYKTFTGTTASSARFWVRQEYSGCSNNCSAANLTVLVNSSLKSTVNILSLNSWLQLTVPFGSTLSNFTFQVSYSATGASPATPAHHCDIYMTNPVFFV